MKGLTVSQFDKICRACLSQSEEIFQIFEVTYDNTHLQEIFCTYLNIEIERDDPLPQHICKSCIVLLVQLHMFILHCQRSDVVLKTLLKKHNESARFSCDSGNAQNNQETCDFETDLKDEIKYELCPDLSDHIEYNQEENQTLHDDSILFEDLLYKDKDIQSSCDNVEQNNRERCNFKEELEDDENLLDCIEYGQEKGGTVDEDKKKSETCSYHCRYCSISFNSYNDIKVHRRKVKHPRPRNHECPECGKFIKSDLKVHMRSHTMEKPFVCQLCQRKFSLKYNLRRHMMTHTGEKPYVCDICGKGFIRSVTLTEHKKVHTGEKPFICSYCGLRFAQAAKLKLHRRRHLSENRIDKRSTRGKNGELSYNYKCDVCLKSFTSRRILNYHQLVHREKGFLCTHCGKAFVYKAGLLAHMKVHTGDKPYSCSICGKAFSYLGSMNSHKLTHTGEKPYTCTVCNRKFSHLHNLKKHTLIHTGEKPFVCKVCSKTFTQTTHLKYHMRTHSGERPYACAYCDKTFALKINLTVHTRTHTGETPYVCDVCGKGFYDSSSMKKHKKRHEGGLKINTSDSSILV